MNLLKLETRSVAFLVIFIFAFLAYLVVAVFLNNPNFKIVDLTYYFSLANTIIWLIGLLLFYLELDKFRKRNTLDQWIAALSGKYHDHCFNVRDIIESHKNDTTPDELIKQIENNPESRKSVDYIINYLAIKSTVVKEGILDKELTIRLSKCDIIYYYDGLKSWIDKKKKEAYMPCFFRDLDWLYEECKKE